MMLPGDYVAYRMTGRSPRLRRGSSEGILWEMQGGPACIVPHGGFRFLRREVIPEVHPNFAMHGEVHAAVAAELGIPAGTPVSYRAGDQPNNAFSLNVLEPGELAATAGTSGVVYGIVDHPAYDPRSRVNTFVHVNHGNGITRFGVLLCLNGTGILNRWLKQNCVDVPGCESSYREVNELAEQAPIGSEGVVVLPYGNGAERTLENADPGASVHGLNFNIHERSHLLRAGQEGIVFALAYGLEIMSAMGMRDRNGEGGTGEHVPEPALPNRLRFDHRGTGRALQHRRVPGSGPGFGCRCRNLPLVRRSVPRPGASGNRRTRSGADGSLSRRVRPLAGSPGAAGPLGWIGERRGTAEARWEQRTRRRGATEYILEKNFTSPLRELHGTSGLRGESPAGVPLRSAQNERIIVSRSPR